MADQPGRFSAQLLRGALGILISNFRRAGGKALDIDGPRASIRPPVFCTKYIE
jgi:hypothetical protein